MSSPRPPAPIAPSLFEVSETRRPDAATVPTAAPDPRKGARLRVPNRGQIMWGRIDLDATVPEDHVVRAIAAVVERFDLSSLYAQVAARDEVAGAPAIDPKILLCLWIYATSEGEGSAREIARLTGCHDAYRWLCGGVHVGAHTLSDFRSQQGEVFSDLITQVLALLMKAEVLDLSRVAQDGMRVRAHAGAASFRREQTLLSLMEEARRHLEEVTRQALEEGHDARRSAARKRGAKDRLARIEAALAQLPEVVETKKRSGAKDTVPRVSTTDPDARVMKMPDGGYRPAFNVQYATTTDKARAIVGVDVTNRGSDKGESTPMLDQVEQRTGVRPREYLVDGGFAERAALEHAAETGVTVYAPVPKPREGDTRDPHAPREGDSDAVAQWRVRMGTDEAKAIYKERAATAETVNADAKTHRGLDQFAVRGITKVLGSASLVALTYDILRLITLTA